MDNVMKIYKELKSGLEEAGLVINNEKGVSNLIILALSKAFDEGKELGENLGRNKTIVEFKSKIREMNKSKILEGK